MSLDGPLGPRPMPSSFDDDEEANKPALQRVTERLTREPLVPIGCVLTVAALTNAWLAMRKGDHARVQRMFRARVMAQGFTVLAVAAGGMYFADERHRARELWRLEKQREAEEKRQKWIRELEARDEEDKAVRDMLAKKKQRRAAVKAEAASRAAAAESQDVDENDAAGAKALGPNDDPTAEGGNGPQSSILGGLASWFGGGGGGSEQSPKPEPPPDAIQVTKTDSVGTRK